MDVETVRFVKTFDKQSVLSVKYEEKKYLSVVLLGSFFFVWQYIFSCKHKRYANPNIHAL